jgi:hypothetical protein
MTDTLVEPAEPQVGWPPVDRRRVPWGAGPAVLAPAALFAWHAAQYGRWEVDDAAITFSYARSVAIGAGPVLQPGLPPVEGFSDPAWLALLVVGRWLGLFDHGTWFGVPDYVAYPKVLALVLVTGMFGCFYAAASAVSRRPAVVTVLAGAVCAAIPSFVIWCVSGLENSLFALAVVAIATVMVRAHARGRLASWGPALACGLLAALAALTRPEGAIYAAAYPLAVLIMLRWPRCVRSLVAVAVSVVAFLVPYGAYLAWRWSTFHAWLPTTAVAKSQGLPTAAGFAKVSDLVAYGGWLAVLLGVLVVGAAAARSSSVRHAVVLVLVPLGLALVAYGVLRPDWMTQYRFATPVWALGALVVGLAAVEVVGGLRWRGRAVLAVVLAGAAVISGAQWIAQAAVFRAEPVAPMCLIVVNSGREFNGYVDILGLTNPTLFAPEIGGDALTGTSLLTDGAGLAEPTIAKLWAAKDWAGVRDYVLDDVRPSFLKAHGQFRTQMAFDTDPRFVRDYVLIGETPNKGGNWVRRDLVRDPATMARLQDWARQALAADAAQRATPLASCGDRLTPGATRA